MVTPDSLGRRVLIAVLLVAACPAIALAQAKPALVHSVDVNLPPPIVLAPQYVTAGSSATYLAELVASAGTNSVACEIVRNGTIVGPPGHTIQFHVGPTEGPVIFSCMQSDGVNISPPGFTTISAVSPVQNPVISAPASLAAGTHGITASIPVQPNWNVALTVTNGKITSVGGVYGVTAFGSNTITFNAGTPGTLILNVSVTGLDQTIGVGQAQIQLLQAITAPASVAAGTPGVTASVNAQPNSDVTWTITGGTITNTNVNTVTFTAGTPGTLTLAVSVVGPDNSTFAGQVQIQVN